MRTTSLAALLVVMVAAGCAGDPASGPGIGGTSTAPATAPPGPSKSAASALADAAEKAAGSPGASPAGSPQAEKARHHRARVLAISLDGLNPAAIEQLGRDGTPALHRLLAEGASTLNARSEVEATVTLPNHAGMLTGRRVDAARDGHGVTFNDDNDSETVQEAAGRDIKSIFDVVHDAGGTTALFTSKTKFALFERSWPTAIDRFEVNTNNAALTASLRADLVQEEREFTFLHVSLPDVVGHAEGFMSPAYLDAVRETDALLGQVLATVDASRALSRRLVVVLTADHGGVGLGHNDATALANYRVPFVVWGRSVLSGDLYALDPSVTDPGTTQPDYDSARPVRNGDLANLTADLLELGPVPGSEFDARQDLDVTRP